MHETQYDSDAFAQPAAQSFAQSEGSAIDEPPAIPWAPIEQRCAEVQPEDLVS